MGAVLCGVGERNGWENVKLEWSGVGGVEFEGKEGEKFKPSIPSHFENANHDGGKDVRRSFEERKSQLTIRNRSPMTPRGWKARIPSSYK
jgi:hypothetical protein